MTTQEILGPRDGRSAPAAGGWASFDRVFDAAAIGMAFVDLEGRYQRVNQALCEFLGRSRQELVGSRFDDVAHPDDAEAERAALGQLLTGELERYRVDKRFVRADGQLRWAACTGALAYGEDGRPRWLVKQVTDVTEHKRTEESLRANEARLRALLESAPDGILIVDGEGRIVSVNARMRAMFGYEPSELVGQPVEVLVPERLRSAHHGHRGRYLADPRTRPMGQGTDLTARRKDGTEFPVEIGLGAARQGGAPLVTCVVTDVTQRKRVEAERSALADAQRRAAERATRLQRVTAALAEALTTDEVARVVVVEGGAAVGAAAGGVGLVAEDGTSLRFAALGGFGAEVAAAWTEVPLDVPTPVTEAVKARAPVFLVGPEELRNRYPALAREVATTVNRAWGVLPLVTSGRSVGAWALAWDAERGFDDDERVFMLTLADQAAVALERARLYERERSIAAELQRALLPERLPEVDGASVAVRYRPGGTAAAVGGDWYDVVRLPQGTVGVVVGDVTGHGVQAAALMGQLRNAMRAYATEGHPPAAVAARVNRLLAESWPDQLATCCYLELDPAEGTATVVRAGHPPPVVVGPEGATRLAAEVDAGLPLGVDPDASYGETTLLLGPGDTVVLYTDGLVESAALPLGEGLERLVTVAASAGAGGGAEALADRLLGAAGSADASDDVALLVLRYEPAAHWAGADRCVRRRLPSDRASVGAARRFAADVLAQWHATELADTVALLVSELVTNAVVHTPTDVELTLCLGPERLRVEVVDESERLPESKATDDEATTGRGLFIVEALAQAWGVEARGAGGKAVWFELARSEDRAA